MLIVFWFKAYSTIKVYFFSTTFVESISEMGEDLVFKLYFPNIMNRVNYQKAETRWEVKMFIESLIIKATANFIFFKT